MLSAPASIPTPATPAHEPQGEVARLLGPGRVPPGFTVGGGPVLEGWEERLAEGLESLEEQAGRALGDPADPLLVSIRSDARDSTQATMDTVLHVGLNDRSVEGLARATGDERFAWDCYRSLVQTFGSACRGVAGEPFRELVARCKQHAGVRHEVELSATVMRLLTGEFQRVLAHETGEPFPQDPWAQLRQAVAALLAYRTGELDRQAVTVQRIVFGNRGARSCSGVAFSRNVVTGERTPSGDFTPNAQDGCAGTTPRDLGEMKHLMPRTYDELLASSATLESHYKVIQETEFIVEEGSLYVLGSRAADRSAQAAVRFAVDAVEEGLLDRPGALATIDAAKLHALLQPVIARDGDFEVLAQGVAASPGAAKGRVVFSAQAAVTAAEAGRDVILVRPFTDDEDVAGLHAAKGILTAEGGTGSHAARVARAIGKPCVSGASALQIDLDAKQVVVDGFILREGDLIAIDGSAGVMTVEDVPLAEPPPSAQFETVLAWADELSTLGVRANTDTAEDAAKARRLGAQGIGLCRTEWMFMAPDRQSGTRAMIMAKSEEDRRAALEELLPPQQQDFERLFDQMGGLPVAIRLLDSPLQEFLPEAESVARELERLAGTEARDEVEMKLAADRLWTTGAAAGGIAKAAKRMVLARQQRRRAARELVSTLERIHSLTEGNPTLGMRGVRLAILHPEIYEMQVRAIVRAALEVDEPPQLQIMIPLVTYEKELELIRELVRRIVDEEGSEQLDLKVGAMIELPQACMAADRLARHADFFSFGTNDLTQTALGFSRADAGRFLTAYVERRLLERSPFHTIDERCVGGLVRLAAGAGRETKPDLELGICGEHGGDPASIALFQGAGLDYVSCLPHQVPMARVAAAQAAIAAGPRSSPPPRAPLLG